jgi:glycosyltransferase involved in cell wall biosynthesis
VSDKRQSILIIGMADSVHVARWLSQFVDQPIDFTLFPSSPHRKIHPMLKKLIASNSQQLTVTIMPSSMRWLALPLSALDIPFRNFFRTRLLRRLIEDNSYDLIHVLELQHAGYLLLDTKLQNTLPNVFITNWGSDIYWFEQFPKHKQKIIQLLKIASYYSAECKRDIEIVQRLGYTGTTLPVIPNSGGINLDELPINSTPPSQRRKIMIKGYTGFVGQALVAIKACELAAEHLRGYEIVIYSASIRSRIRALKLRHINKVRVTILRKQTPHSEMLQQFSEARIYIGISLSDGISTSLLEAMATGCYPIQTDTACANEWFTTRSGSMVKPDDLQQVSAFLQLALSNDSLVDSSSQINIQTIRARASVTTVSTTALGFYQNLANSPKVV